MLLPGNAVVMKTGTDPEHRGQSVYWSIGMSMGWDCGPEVGTAAALPEKRGVSLRPEFCEAEEV